jgi:hypothetical protein
MPPTPVFAAGVALAPDGPTLSAIDVLRGRAVGLWPRAFVDGRPVPVRAWRLVTAAGDVPSRRTGTGDQPADLVWLAPSSEPHSVVFEVTIDAAPGRALIAALAVTVRSPALVS